MFSSLEPAATSDNCCKKEPSMQRSHKVSECLRSAYAQIVFGGLVWSGFRPPVARTETETGPEKSQTVKRPNWTGR